MEPKGNLIYLETLRGLAAFVVVLTHLQFTFFGMQGGPAGAFSVRLFFLLSGFVLSISFFRKGKPVMLVSAALRRYPRLMFPVLASVMFFWVLMEAHGFKNHEAAIIMNQGSDSWLNHQAMVHLTGIEALAQGSFNTFFRYDENTTLNSSLWTMSFELKGSAFIFMLLATLAFIRRKWLLYPVITLCLVLLDRRFSFYLIDFLAGAILCEIFVWCEQSGKLNRIPGSIAVILLIIGCILGVNVISLTAISSSHVPPWIAELLTTFSSALIVGVATFSLPLRQVLEHSSISFLGRISFPLYLFHNAIIYSVGCICYLTLRKASFDHLTAGLFASGLSILVALLVAWIAYYLVELPSIRVSKLFSHFCLFLFRPKEIDLS